VRSGDAATDELLRRLLAAHLVPGLGAPANLSIMLASAESGRGPVQAFNQLFRGSQLVVRTRDPRRAVQALLTYLAALGGAPDPSLLHVTGLPAVANGRGVVLPRGILSSLKTLQPRLHRAGIALVDAPMATIDPRIVSLVVPEPGLGDDAAVLAEVPEARRLGAELPRVEPGAYPLAAWAFPCGPGEQGRLTPGRALARALAAGAADDTTPIVEAATRLRPLLAEITPYGLWYATIDDLLAEVGRMLGEG